MFNEKSCPPTGSGLDIIAASQGGTWAVIHTDCWVFTPAESANVLSLLNHMRTQAI